METRNRPLSSYVRLEINKISFRQGDVFGDIAKSSVLAQIDKQNWEGGNNWWRNIVYALFGVLGILKKWHAYFVLF